MEKYSVEIIIIRLISYFKLKNMTELAEKLGVSQSVMSNWKSRNAIGPICERVLEVDPQALSSIFNVGTQNNTISNTSVNGGGSVIDNSNRKNIAVGSSKVASNNIPAYIIDDLNNLFLRASENNKTKEIIEAFDDFIYTQKKSLRN